MWPHNFITQSYDISLNLSWIFSRSETLVSSRNPLRHANHRSLRHWYATIGVSCDIWQKISSTKSCNVRLPRRIVCIYYVQKNSVLRARSDVLSRYLQKSSRSSAYSHKKNGVFPQHRQNSHEVLSARLMSKETPQSPACFREKFHTHLNWRFQSRLFFSFLFHHLKIYLFESIMR